MSNHTATTITVDRPDSSSKVGLAVGIIVAFLIIGSIFIYFIWFKRRKRSSESKIPRPLPAVKLPTTTAIHKPVLKVDTTPKLAPSKAPTPPVDIRLPPISSYSPAPRVLFHKPPSSIRYPCRLTISDEYVKSLTQLRPYLNTRYKGGYCYCTKHYPNDRSDTDLKAGSTYAVPRGWTAYLINVDPVFAKVKNIWAEWYTCYYGTTVNKLQMILRNRFIPFHGDMLLGGELFTTHLDDKEHCHTSPSIKYASDQYFSPRTIFTTSDNHVYYIQVVLQCKQAPDSVIPGYKYINNDVIPNNHVEWKSAARSSVLPHKLLIRVLERDTEKY
ncbi:unnamed protein product [Didymodactylos carnosus]|uniref:Uncharacterized protein n=1 Tax=Didymodactylos carnosus TaxID=1234261 RepID=A0A814KK65_9BILA|nr:unnamed protein product [Didymodactylos carnosus]CAF1139988.1 unnamed protein product [Didymodactylos carnosus]CAF3820250.1 unnamed protein product [Didymodactylos carnosus]CAF3933853.1 unnamed protein product [Didymodactylos carnosus]